MNERLVVYEADVFAGAPLVFWITYLYSRIPDVASVEPPAAANVADALLPLIAKVPVVGFVGAVVSTLIVSSSHFPTFPA